MTNLKLYVWEDVLCDWTCGVMFALAPDVDTARKLIKENVSYVPGDDLMKEPDEYDEPFGLAVWGGG